MPSFDAIADNFNELWDFGEPYRQTVINAIQHYLQLTPTSLLADLGGGTGRTLLQLADTVPLKRWPYCVEPAHDMLAVAAKTNRMYCFGGTAESFADTFLWPSPNRLLIKEAVHLIKDRPAFWRQMHDRFPGSRTLIVTRQPDPGFPLFHKAKALFAAGQPTVCQLAQEVEQGGLTARIHYKDVPIPMTYERWLTMLRGRFMSDLMKLSDEEIEKGIEEITDSLPKNKPFAIEDRLVFITVE